MSPHTPDPVWTLGLAALAALTLAVEGGSARDDAAEATGRQAVTAPRQDTVRVGDRRCLTRRAEDCLAEPVPVDEPHGAVCAVCHDMWRGREPAQTARACSGGECHRNPVVVSDFHRTVSGDVLAQCAACHRPHDFRVEGGAGSCTTCHAGGGATVIWVGERTPSRLAPGLSFAHEEHASVACGTCHGEDAGHGTVRVADREDCRGCHHTAPLADRCTACHDVSEVAATAFAVTRRFEIRVGSLDRPVRAVVFHHADHWQHTGCAVCHTGGIDLETAKGADCSGCHLQHHEPTANCITCHEQPKPGAHDRTAHFGCGGEGCHDPVPAGIEGAPRTRELCQVCHQDLVDHEPARNCVDCHILPPPR